MRVTCSAVKEDRHQNKMSSAVLNEECKRERIMRTDIEAFGTTARCQGCNAIRSRKRAQAHSDRVRIEECPKTTPEERLDRRREVLNEALANEVE